MKIQSRLFVVSRYFQIQILLVLELLEQIRQILIDLAAILFFYFYFLIND